MAPKRRTTPKPKAGRNLLAPLSPEEYEALKADIETRGLLSPIVIDAKTGQVVDGHHRLKACRSLGIEPEVLARDYESTKARQEEALSLNLLRRQMGPTEWGQAFARLLEVRGVPRGQRGRTKEEADLPTFAELAEAVGVPERTARWRLRLWEELEDAPDLAHQVDAGEITAREASRHAAQRKARTNGTNGATANGASANGKHAEAKTRNGKRRTANGGDAWQLLEGDCLDVLAKLDPDSCDSLITDPPSGADAAGAEWDGARGGRDAWIDWLQERAEAMLRVLKPGAHGAVWALPRTSHWTAAALEDAGFELRDVVTHIFAQGFPKSRDLGPAVSRLDPDQQGQWDGWRAAVGPAAEHWLLVRKPLAGATAAESLADHSTGALNIEGARTRRHWPRNLLLSHHQDCELLGMKQVRSNAHWPDWQVVGYSRGDSLNGAKDPALEDRREGTEEVEEWACVEGCPAGQLADQSRFFFQGKPSQQERDAGLGKGRRNRHPTVKPLGLLRHLITLTTPPGGLVLDPFAGTASVGCAACSCDPAYRYLGMEEESQWVRVGEERLAHWAGEMESAKRAA